MKMCSSFHLQTGSYNWKNHLICMSHFRYSVTFRLRSKRNSFSLLFEKSCHQYDGTVRFRKKPRSQLSCLLRYDSFRLSCHLLLYSTCRYNSCGIAVAIGSCTCALYRTCIVAISDYSIGSTHTCDDTTCRAHRSDRTSIVRLGYFGINSCTTDNSSYLIDC
mgnify:CR=1 FL=1